MTDTDAHHRTIRSFVRREGRITRSQQRALEELLPVFGLSSEGHIDPVAVFGRSAPLTLEIGFGNGDSLATMAEQDTASDFIGIEVHRPGVGHLLLELERRETGNVRVMCDDAMQVVRYCLPDGSLDRVLLFFPDPWPKKRHHKRRIVQPAFAELVARHAAMVYGTCRRVLGNAADAEEVAQECFLQLISARIRIRDSLGPWLHTVAQRRA